MKGYFCLESRTHSQKCCYPCCHNLTDLSASSLHPLKSILSSSTTEVEISEGTLYTSKVNPASCPRPRSLYTWAPTCPGPVQFHLSSLTVSCHSCLLAVPTPPTSQCVHLRVSAAALLSAQADLPQDIGVADSFHHSGFCSDITSRRLSWIILSVLYHKLHISF